jgi:putative intracellular protease/amidase
MNKAWRLALVITAFASSTAFSAPAPAAAQPVKVAILVFDKAENIDFTGPLQVFDDAGFEAFTVAADRKTVVVSGGLSVMPQFTFTDSPDADVSVIPGGQVDDVMMDPAVLDWIKTKAGRAKHVMSVCNGAFILAHTGLLEGATATTTSGNVKSLREHSPGTKVVRDKRVVDHGKVITTGGLSAGIDGALHVVAKIRGEGNARFVAQTLEYDWRPEGGYVPATYALRHLPMYLDRKLAKLARVDKVVSSEGNAQRWNITFLVTSEAPPATLLPQIGTMLSTYGAWGKPTVTPRVPREEWQFKDDDGRQWTASARLFPVKGNDQQQVLAIAVSAKKRT